MERKVFTIGFTKSTAERFFNRLIKADVKKVIDVRINNTSQLAGFAKANDLSYLLRSVGNIEYLHQPLLAPTQAMLADYKKYGGSWDIYEKKFLELMEERRIETRFKAEAFDGACLLCSEDTPHHCHRRLVCDYLNLHWNGVLKVSHL